jgi:soluble lytic murein transglycosylase
VRALWLLLIAVPPVWYFSVVPLFAWRELQTPIRVIKDEQQSTRAGMAAGALDAAYAYAPDNPYVNFYRGLWSAIQGRRQDALESWRRCERLASTEMGVFFSKVLLPGLETGRAPSLTRDELAGPAISTTELERLSPVALYSRELDVAAGMLVRASLKDPRSPSVQRLSGVLDFLLGERRSGMLHLERAWTLRSSAPAMLDLGVGYVAFRFRLVEMPGGVQPTLSPWLGKITTPHQQMKEHAVETLFNLIVLHHSRQSFKRSLHLAQVLEGSFGQEVTAQQLTGPLEKYLYPRNYSDAIEGEAARNGVDPALVYALIREESHYDPASASPAGARGLMQLMPQTGRWIAGKLKRTGYRESELLSPLSNIQMGIWYLAHLAETMPREANRLDWLLAAYNGGPGNAALWRAEWKKKGGQPEDHIAFAETRNYVTKVRKSYAQYRRVWNSAFSPSGEAPGVPR